MRASNKIFTGVNLHIIGDNNTITGPNARATGNNNSLTGPNCHAIGDGNTLTGPNCHARGDNNTLTGPNCHASGDSNTLNDAGEAGFSVNNFAQGTGIVQRFNNRAGSIIGGVRQAEDESISIVMGGPGGMRVIRNGVEVKPFMTSKKEKGKSKSKKRERQDEEVEEKFIEGPTPKDMEQDKEAADEAMPCDLCLTRARICIIAPCNHMTLCVQCSRQLCFGDNDMPRRVGTQKCPNCRASIESIKRVFQ